MPYWRLYYHVVWATRHREPMISEGMIEPIVRAIEQTTRESGVNVFAVGVMADHVHVLAQIPPSLAPSAVIGQWKGASSHAANSQGPESLAKLAWQAGYGVQSVSQRGFDQVRDYVLNQRQRHAARQVYGAYERTEDVNDEAIRRPASRSIERR